VVWQVGCQLAQGSGNVCNALLRWESKAERPHWPLRSKQCSENGLAGPTGSSPT